MADDTENFNGTDGDDLDTLTGWTTQEGTADSFEILSNTLSAANWTDRTLVTYIDRTSADCFIEAEFITFATNRRGSYLVLRAVDKLNWVGIRMHGTGSSGVRLVSCIAGTLDDTHVQTQGAANDVYRVEAVGSDFELFVNGVSKGSATIAGASTTELSGGVVMFANNVGATSWIDSLTFGELGGGGGLSVPIAAYHYNHSLRA